MSPNTYTTSPIKPTPKLPEQVVCVNSEENGADDEAVPAASAAAAAAATAPASPPTASRGRHCHYLPVNVTRMQCSEATLSATNLPKPGVLHQNKAKLSLCVYSNTFSPKMASKTDIKCWSFRPPGFLVVLLTRINHSTKRDVRNITKSTS